MSTLECDQEKSFAYLLCEMEYRAIDVSENIEERRKDIGSEHGKNLKQSPTADIDTMLFANLKQPIHSIVVFECHGDTEHLVDHR